MEINTTDDDKKFLARFLAPGWLAASRDDNTEHLAVARGLREGLLYRNCSEAHFTKAGRATLAAYAMEGI